MPWIEESGFEFELPPDRYFRFDQCGVYQSHLSHEHVSDVDFVWYRQTDPSSPPIVWMMEVKHVRRQGAQDFEIDAFVEDLIDQVTDGLMMLAGLWADSAIGRALYEEIEATCPNFPRDVADLRVVLALRLDRTDAPQLLQPVTERIRRRMHGRLHLLQQEELDTASPTRVLYAPLHSNAPDVAPISWRPAGSS